MHDVAVLHDISLALLPHLARGLDLRLRGACRRLLEIRVRANFGLDEAPLEVSVDDAGSLRGQRPPPKTVQARTSSVPTVKKYMSLSCLKPCLMMRCSAEGIFVCLFLSE